MAAPKQHDAAQAPIVVLDTMRSRSHLFCRYLATNTRELATIHSPFSKSRLLGKDCYANQARNSEARKQDWRSIAHIMTENTVQDAQRELLRNMGAAKSKELRPVIDSHALYAVQDEPLYGVHRTGKFEPVPENPTCFPDELFETMQLVLLIRHPLRAVDAIRRITLKMGMHIHPSDEEFEVMASLSVLRWLYDLFAARGRKAVVVDGDDIVHRTLPMKANLCVALKLDAENMSETWEPGFGPFARYPPGMTVLVEGILASKGI